MNRLVRLGKVVKAAWSVNTAAGPLQTSLAPGTQLSQLSGNLGLWQTRSFAAPAESLASDNEQATGLERSELEGRAKGIDIFHEDWLDAPFGTEDSPVQVTSSFTERIVGVPDPYDDSITWWGTIKEGEPPKQIVEGGEFFVLKRSTDEGTGHSHLGH